MARIWLLLLAVTLPAWGVDVPGSDLPDVAFTQGANAPDGAGVHQVAISDLCPHANTTAIRNVPDAVKKQVFAEYGLTPMRDDACTGPGKSCYEIDHLCSLELGCTNTPENLWPQRYDGTVWNAHVKDKLENTLHKMICDHQMTIQEAQQCVSVDWIECYKKVFDQDGK